MTTHLYFLLDRSGSMASMAHDVIGGFNGFLASQRAAGDDARMTLVQFDTQDAFEVLVDARRLAKVRDLTATTFVPRGGTPLLDATGELITRASVRSEQRQAMGKAPEDILVVTFTDGEENASRRFAQADVVRLVAAKEAAGWTFVFLGAGLDAYAESGSFGYGAGSVQAFAPDAPGARLAFDSLDRATTEHRRKVRLAEPVDPRDFFAGEKPAEADRKHRGR